MVHAHWTLPLERVYHEDLIAEAKRRAASPRSYPLIAWPTLAPTDFGVNDPRPAKPAHLRRVIGTKIHRRILATKRSMVGSASVDACAFAQAGADAETTQEALL